MGALPSSELWEPDLLPVYPLPTPEVRPGGPRPKRSFLMLLPICDKYFYLRPGPGAWRPRWRAPNLSAETSSDAAKILSENGPASSGTPAAGAAAAAGGASMMGSISDLLMAYYIARNDEHVDALFARSTDERELETDNGAQEPQSPKDLYKFLVSQLAPFTVETNVELRRRIDADPRSLRLLPCAIAMGFIEDDVVAAPAEDGDDDDDDRGNANILPTSAASHQLPTEASIAEQEQRVNLALTGGRQPANDPTPGDVPTSLPVAQDVDTFIAACSQSAHRYQRNPGGGGGVMPEGEEKEPSLVDDLRTIYDTHWNLPEVELPDGCGSRGCIIGFIGLRNTKTQMLDTPSKLWEHTGSSWLSPVVSPTVIQPAFMLGVQMAYLQAKRAGLVGAVVPGSLLAPIEKQHDWMYHGGGGGCHFAPSKPSVPLLQHPDTSLFMHILYVTTRHNWGPMRVLMQLAAQLLLPLDVGTPLRCRMRETNAFTFWIDPLHIDYICGQLLLLMDVHHYDESSSVRHSPVVVMPTCQLLRPEEPEESIIERGVARLDNEEKRQLVWNMWDAYKYLRGLEDRSPRPPSAGGNPGVLFVRRRFASYQVIKFVRPTPSAATWTQQYSVKHVMDERDWYPEETFKVRVGNGKMTPEVMDQVTRESLRDWTFDDTEGVPTWFVTISGPRNDVAFAVRRCTSISSNYRIQIWRPVPGGHTADFFIENRAFRFVPGDDGRAVVPNVKSLITGLCRPTGSQTGSTEQIPPALSDGRRCVAVDLMTRIILDPSSPMTLQSKIAVIADVSLEELPGGFIVELPPRSAFDPPTELLVPPRTCTRHVARYLFRVGRLQEDEYVGHIEDPQACDEPLDATRRKRRPPPTSVRAQSDPDDVAVDEWTATGNSSFDHSRSSSFEFARSVDSLDELHYDVHAGPSTEAPDVIVPLPVRTPMPVQWTRVLLVVRKRGS